MLKRQVWFQLIIILLLQSATEAAKRPNILFIMSDDHASEAIGAYKSWLKDYVHTPMLDRLATEGMRFTNVCCNNSICSPSRASIVTGQYSHITGALNLNCRLKPEAPSYIRELTQNGYDTCVVGKWHMQQFPRGVGNYAVTKGQGKYFNPILHRPDGSQEKYEGYYADRYTDWALKWLKKRDHKKPFYLSLHFKGPHESFEYPERWAKLHEGRKIPEPPTLHEDVEANSPHLKAMHYSSMFDAKSPKPYYLKYEHDLLHKSDKPRERRSIAYQHMIHKFLRCVAAIDDNVKRVYEYLESEGILDNTLIIYTSDQGYWLGQHNMHDKRLILEESLKMPFIVRYPKEVKAGIVNDRLGMNIDFGPTMLDFAGIKIPKVMQGVSLRPLLRGEQPKNWRKAIFYAYYARAPMHWGIRSQTQKLIHFPHTDDIEFYDLKKDPFETVNVAGQSDYQQSIEEHNDLMSQLMKKVGITREYLQENMQNNREKPPLSGVKRKRLENN